MVAAYRGAGQARGHGRDRGPGASGGVGSTLEIAGNPSGRRSTWTDGHITYARASWVPASPPGCAPSRRRSTTGSLRQARTTDDAIAAGLVLRHGYLTTAGLHELIESIVVDAFLVLTIPLAWRIPPSRASISGPPPFAPTDLFPRLTLDLVREEAIRGAERWRSMAWSRRPRWHRAISPASFNGPDARAVGGRLPDRRSRVRTRSGHAARRVPLRHGPLPGQPRQGRPVRTGPHRRARPDRAGPGLIPPPARSPEIAPAEPLVSGRRRLSSCRCNASPCVYRGCRPSRRSPRPRAGSRHRSTSCARCSPACAASARPVPRSRVTSVDDLAHGAPGDGAAAPDRALLRQIPRTDQLLADPRLRLAERPARPGPGQGRGHPRAGPGAQPARSPRTGWPTPPSPNCPRPRRR